MENSNTEITYGSQCEQTRAFEMTDDFIWKALYSHSFTALFQCNNCDYEFDIDGWFYKFDDVICPKCKTVYSGVFGRIKQHSNSGKNGQHSDCIEIETFEGQMMRIPVPSGTESTVDHIILLLFLEAAEKQSKSWAMIDYSTSKPKLQLFYSSRNHEKNKIPKNRERKQKSLLAYLFFGVLSAMGILGFLIVVFPGLSHF